MYGVNAGYVAIPYGTSLPAPLYILHKNACIFSLCASLI